MHMLGSFVLCIVFSTDYVFAELLGDAAVFISGLVKKILFMTQLKVFML